MQNIKSISGALILHFLSMLAAFGQSSTSQMVVEATGVVDTVVYDKVDSVKYRYNASYEFWRGAGRYCLKLNDASGTSIEQLLIVSDYRQTYTSVGYLSKDSKSVTPLKKKKRIAYGDIADGQRPVSDSRSMAKPELIIYANEIVSSLNNTTRLEAILGSSCPNMFLALAKENDCTCVPVISSCSSSVVDVDFYFPHLGADFMKERSGGLLAMASLRISINNEGLLDGIDFKRYSYLSSKTPRFLAVQMIFNQKGAYVSSIPDVGCAYDKNSKVYMSRRALNIDYQLKGSDDAPIGNTASASLLNAAIEGARLFDLRSSAYCRIIYAIAGLIITLSMILWIKIK